jgi:uncharacterized protein (TIGR02391 family)
MFKEIFPPIETVLEMEPEELAPFVLKHVQKSPNINRYNYSLPSPEMIEYAGREHLKELQERLMEAFIWLEREMFIAPRPGETGDWRFITRRGEKILQDEDFKAYVKGSLLSSETLHPILVRKVKPLFLRGDYDTAIFQAFKAIEVEVRKKGGYAKGDIGTPLMRKAFNPKTGSLTNTQSEESEKQAMSDLFAGAIGLFKNPVSHRFIETIIPEDAADLIRFANFLLKTLGA